MAKIYITLDSDFCVTEVVQISEENKRGWRSVTIPIGRHLFDETVNPFCLMSDRDQRFRTTWLVEHGTNKGLAVESWAMALKEGRSVKKIEGIDVEDVWKKYKTGKK
ncbi:MAG: hypothetical protein AAB505_01945 [Patescibacteria group bacterium]